MRPAPLSLSLLLTATLSGCNREPAFDERFQDATASINASAHAIDAEITATDSAPSAPLTGANSAGG